MVRYRPSEEMYAEHAGHQILTCLSQELIFSRKDRSLAYCAVPSCWARPWSPKRGVRTKLDLVVQHFHASSV